MPHNITANAGLMTILTDKNQLIRMYVNVGAAYGNQAANLNLLRRLRNLGYRGNVEFIYADAIREKIKYLFSLPEDFGSIFDAGNGIVFYTVSQHIKRYLTCKLPPVKLAMTAAWDNYALEDKLTTLTPEMAANMTNFDLEKFAEENNLFLNYADLMNANVFIRYSQFQTNRKHNFYKHTMFHLRGESEVVTDPDSGNKFLVVPTNTFADAYQFLNTSAGQQLIERRPLLPALMAAYQNSNIKILPCYGYTLLNHDSVQNLINIIIGARYAQLMSSISYSIIVPFFTELNWMALAEIQQTMDWAFSSAQRAAISGSELKLALTIGSLKDINDGQLLANLQPGKILLLATGALPQVVFNALYAYSGPNLLMQVREGQSSFVGLMQTGKPHLRCGGVWELGFDDMPDAGLRNQFSLASQVCESRTNIWQTLDVATVVRDYILSAQDPDSSLSQYFKNLSLKVQDPRNDRILSGLTHGMTLFEKTGWEYSDIITGDYYPMTRPLPHCSPLSQASSWVELLAISLPLLFWMTLLARKIYQQEIKHFNLDKTFFAVKKIKDDTSRSLSSSVEVVNRWVSS